MSDEVVILGGGPAGAIAAWHLARAGRSPLLIEREAGPRHKICGEFLSIETQAALAEVGLHPSALGAPAIDRLRLVHGRQVAETRLPFRGYGLTRRTLDEALLEKAADAGARLVRGTAVRAIDGMSLTIGDDVVTPERLLLATGKHDVRGAKRDAQGTTDDLVGFKAYFRLADAQTAALAGHIEVLLFDGGYAGLQLVEDGMANLCLLVRRDAYGRAGRQWPTLLTALRASCGHLDERLAGATPLLDRPLTIAGVPYGFVYRPQPDDRPGFYRLGDQCAVIPSFSGDGMAIAMHSGRAAALAVLGSVDARDYHSERRRELRRQIMLAQAVYRLGEPAAAQPLLVAAARLWPGLARRLAAWTRIPQRAWSPTASAL